MSASNTTSFNLQSLSEEAVAISADSAVVDQRSALLPQQVNESNVDALVIDSLPDEMIVEVFSHLNQNELGRIARVCRRWSVLAKSPALWRKVNVEIFCSDAQSVESLIDRLPSCVTSIQLDFPDQGSLDFEKLCMQLHHRCPNVEVLILAQCFTKISFPEVINSCTQFLQDLKKLVLYDCIFRDYSLALYWSHHYPGTVELEYNSTIEVLDLYWSDPPDSSKIQFSKLLSLNELRLAETFVDDDWFMGDASFLNQLHVLDLRNTRVTASTFRAIERNGQNLTELYLCGLCLRDDDLHFNGPVFSNLKTLCLSHTLVTREGVVSLVRSCPSLVNVYVPEDVARSFAENPFVVANRCKSEIVKSIDDDHDHINADHLHN